MSLHFFQRFYIMTSNQTQRLMNVRTSPIYSHFSESLMGAATIRAYHRQRDFITNSDDFTDNYLMARYASIIINRCRHATIFLCKQFLRCSVIDWLMGQNLTSCMGHITLWATGKSDVMNVGHDVIFVIQIRYNSRPLLGHQWPHMATIGPMMAPCNVPADERTTLCRVQRVLLTLGFHSETRGCTKKNAVC